jgi:hypothetical protein
MCYTLKDYQKQNKKSKFCKKISSNQKKSLGTELKKNIDFIFNIKKKNKV